jgi:argininosuccinate lyase
MKKGINKVVEKFLESISFDKRLYKYDIQGSIAHVKMLAKCKIIKQSEAKAIIKGLEGIAGEISRGKFKFDSSLEDIHTHIEKRLIRKIGEVGAKLHTARSRNDQVSLDMRLYLKDEIKAIAGLIRGLQKNILKVAEKNIDAVMPGYTHLQHAQPVLFAHWIMAYFFMFARDWERLLGTFSRVDVSPLGSAALAGTSHAIDREYTARLLGFSKIAPSSLDAVSDRDFIIEFLADASLVMMHLSRLSEELILFSTKEFDFITLAGTFTTGSSIMPQKRNPDVCEVVRGKTGAIYGNLMNLLTAMKSLPLAYNRDMQEDKVPLFHTVDTLKGALSLYTEMLGTIKLNKKSMLRALEGDFSLATDLADYLVKKGLPFRTAYEIISTLVKETMKKEKKLTDLTLKDLKVYSPLFKRDVFAILKVESSVSARKSLGGTSPSSVKRLIAQGKRMVGKE